MDTKLKEEFRKLLLDLDDKTTLRSIAEPIKGDIYFDGIEIEAWIDANFISRQELVEELNRLIFGEQYLDSVNLLEQLEKTILKARD